MIPRFLFISIYLAFFKDLGVLAQTSSAKWLFPSSDGTILNFIDTFVLQWESNYADPWMQMWCQNGTAGNNVVLGSNFQVDKSGTYPYILKSDNPRQTDFPVACHAQLATAENGGGVDSPFGLTYISIPKIQSADPKTFSLASASTTSTISSSKRRPSSSSPSSATTFPVALPSASPTNSLPSNTSPALSATSGSSSNPTSSISEPSDISDPNSGMSTAIKVGIGISIVVAVAGIVGFGVWMILRKRSASKKNGYGEHSVPELAANRWNGHELDTTHGYQELDVKPNKPWIYEMPA